MNDEIKEILSYLKKKENTRRIKCITIRESKQLLDYITNLQQENEKLKELCDKYEEHNTAFKLWKMKMEEIPTYEEKEDYKSRINKAIEYIEDTYIFDYENDDRLELKDQWYAKDILNILKGDNNE